MKTFLKAGLLIAMTASLFLSSCTGSYYVTDQPIEPVYERPIPPYDGAIWIDGDWGWVGGRYIYTRGHWERPRVGRTYIRGYWDHGTRGYRWRRGHWK